MSTVRSGSILLACVVLLAAVLIAQQPAAPRFPPRFENYLARAVAASASDRKKLAAGEPITRMLEVDDNSEVAVFGAVWIAAPMRAYVERIRNIEEFERGRAFKVTKRIGSPPSLEDFAALRVPDRDFEDLRTCRVGECAVKLDEAALRKFAEQIDWDGPSARVAADHLMRKVIFDYTVGYMSGGNVRLPVYRDKSHPISVAQHFREIVEHLPDLTADTQQLRNYLVNSPNATLADATSFLYWQIADMGLKPFIRTSQLTIREGVEDTIVASKMLYASHYFWAGLELRALLSDPSRGRGFWFVTVNRSRSDGLTGLTGLFVRRRVRSRVQEGALSLLQATKQKLEASR